MRVPDVVLGAVAYLGVRKHPGIRDTALDYKGSAFVVSVVERGITFYYLVTARHVAKAITAAEDPIARMNDIHGNAFEVELRHTPRAVSEKFGWPTDDSWRDHPDDTVDLSVRSFTPRHDAERTGWELPDLRPIAHVPEYMLVKDDQFGPNGLGVGDEVYIPSLFSFAKGDQSNSPILRVGNLAMIPKEPVRSAAADFGPMEAYLIEARSISGMSGAPVLIRETVSLEEPKGEYDRFDQRLPQFHASGKFHLLGAIHGHWDVRAESVNAAEAKTEPDRRERVNVGVAIVTPARRLRELLHHDKFVKDREHTTSSIRARKEREESAATPDLLTEEDDATYRFDRAASALFQVPKSAVDEAEAQRPKRSRKKDDDA